MKRPLWRALAASLVLSMFFTSAGISKSQTEDAAEVLLMEMTPEERVGQLFIVTFKGSSIDEGNAIVEMISNLHISGVVLRTEHDNFVDHPDTLDGTRSLIAALQDTELEASRELVSGEVAPRGGVYVPLFVGIELEGGGAPEEELRYGVTEYPSQMALGATWDFDLARSVGELMGREMGGLGFNLIVGPSLDVLQDPRLAGPGDLGVRTFGGDPYWVSKIGRAFVEGLQIGSRGRLAIMAKHFPGTGSSDRPLGSEVATIRRSLEQLTRIDLVPFVTVAGEAPSGSAGIVDGVLTSHIRYQGFQGSIRSTTRPLSLDADALSVLMGLEPIASWRSGGGVTMSDSLGSQAVRRFYDPSGLTFNGHLVARDAFFAGNDLLFLDSFASSGQPDEISSIAATVDFFARKYHEDSLFASRVDEAVMRILRLKLRLYGGSFTRAKVAPAVTDFESIGQESELAHEVASRSATLIYPMRDELEEQLGQAPQLGERIVFFTDIGQARQCSGCDGIEPIPRRGLETAVLSLYGFGGAGQVGDWTLESYSTGDLAFYFGETPPTELPYLLANPDDVGNALVAADWLVFCVLRQSGDLFGSEALKLLLDRRPDLTQSRRIVVFGFDVPYELDATDISKIDAFYGLYARSSAYVDVAARLLFRELQAEGAAPVSVPAVDYDLDVALAPDPNQVISLRIAVRTEEGTPDVPGLGFSAGDVIRVVTGVIVDGNGHQVPDGTVVEFTLSYQGEGAAFLLPNSVTQDGIAGIDITLEKLGLLRVTAISEPARTSEILQLNVEEGGHTFVTVIAPTPSPTRRPRPSSTSMVEATATVVATIAVGEPALLPTEEVGLGILDLILGLVGVVMVASVGVVAGMGANLIGREEWLRIVLSAVVGGLMVYNYWALGLPGSDGLHEFLGVYESLVMAGGGALLGLATGLVGGVVRRRKESAETKARSED